MAPSPRSPSCSSVQPASRVIEPPEVTSTPDRIADPGSRCDSIPGDQSRLSAAIGSIRPARSVGISAAHAHAATIPSRLAR